MTNPTINGIFTNLNNRPLRVVLRRRITARWSQYEVFRPKDRISGVVIAIQSLSDEDSSFLETFLALDEVRYRSNERRTRRYIHREKSGLYCSVSSHLARYARPVAGVWLATNLNQTVMETVIQEACEAADIEYGRLSSLHW
jgi:hypothetical protein